MQTRARLRCPASGGREIAVGGEKLCRMLFSSHCRWHKVVIALETYKLKQALIFSGCGQVDRQAEPKPDRTLPLGSEQTTEMLAACRFS